jgi:hypothetical protein
MSSSRIRVLLVSLLAVFAVGAVASASASAAAPEFFHCVAKAGGKWMAGCKVAGTEFEKVAVPAGSKIKFTDKEGVSHLNGLGTVVTCQKDTSSGEITGPKTVANVTVTFQECKGKKGTEECPVNGGTITTATLHGELGKVLKAEAASEVGEDLIPPVEIKEGKEVKLPFVKLEGACIPTTSVEGSVIGEVKPINVMQTTGEVNFECSSVGSTKQKIQKFEPGLKDTLSAFGNPACFESFPDAITFAEAIEVT